MFLTSLYSEHVVLHLAVPAYCTKRSPFIIYGANQHTSIYSWAGGWCCYSKIDIAATYSGAQVTGVLARRGYNVQSLAVGHSEVEGRSRITTVIPGSSESTAKLIKQLNKVINVVKVRCAYADGQCRSLVVVQPCAQADPLCNTR